MRCGVSAQGGHYLGGTRAHFLGDTRLGVSSITMDGTLTVSVSRSVGRGERGVREDYESKEVRKVIKEGRTEGQMEGR